MNFNILIPHMNLEATKLAGLQLKGHVHLAGLCKSIQRQVSVYVLPRDLKSLLSFLNQKLITLVISKVY